MRLLLPDVTVSLTTDRGVFSAGAVDAGTKLLLLEAARVPDGEVDLLDLGCGYGAIAVVLALRAPAARVWAVDVNERALALAAENAEAAGVADRVVACRPEEVPPDVRFAGVWSNPPIRVGKDVLHSTLSQWLGRIEPSGSAYLVVHKHLGADSLAAWLTGRGFSVDRLRSRGGYRVLAVRRSEGGGGS